MSGNLGVGKYGTGSYGDASLPVSGEGSLAGDGAVNGATPSVTVAADPLAYARGRVAQTLAHLTQGTVTITHKREVEPDTEQPWQLGEVEPVTYTLDAVIRGAKEFADGTLVLATDLVVIASTRARNSDGDYVGLTPQMIDTISIDGAVKALKRIEPVPASGTPAKYRIYVAS